VNFLKLISTKEFVGYLHGIAFKILSILAKMYFFFFLVVGLKEGVFFDFFFILTIGAISARVVAAGAEDQIPIDIKCFSRDSPGYIFIYQRLLFLYFISLLSVFISDNIWLIYILSILSFTTTFYFIGILRSYKPKYYEMLTELTWPFFVLIIFLGNLETIHQLVLAFFSVYFLLHVFVYSKTEFGINSRNDYNLVVRTFFNGRSKIVSNLLLVLLLRGLIVWSGFFDEKKDDSLAISVAIGEAFWQICMVIVYRNYSVSCKEGPSYFRVWRTFLVFMLMAVVFSIALYYFNLMFGDRIGLPVDYIFYSVLSYVFIAAILDVRYYYWASGQYTALALLSILLLAVIPLILVIYFPLATWLKLYCAGVFIFMVIIYILSLLDFIKCR